jgi:hypothetical protein
MNGGQDVDASAADQTGGVDHHVVARELGSYLRLVIGGEVDALAPEGGDPVAGLGQRWRQIPPDEAGAANDQDSASGARVVKTAIGRQTA